jgi:1,2-dihydroxy-3-keto-5-methylthiopentene dioxygenase
MRAHFTDNNEPIDAHVLEANGVIYRKLPMDAGAYQPHLDELTQRRGYVTQDIVQLTPDTPNLDVVLAKFDPEHRHDDDEVRFVLEGEGVFDIRTSPDEKGDERWMRVIVEPGDLLVVPKGKHHRFELTAARTIKCVRLFKDPAGWTAIYR